ncbi:MAG TPA: MotA/TolQ/ExbB proton channel family protein [Myxococcales bacterium]|jgi:biopolymer transport protein ExbB/TolQ
MDFTLAQMWAQMGIVAKTVVLILGLFSVTTLGIAIERFVTFARATAQSRAFAQVTAPMLAERKFKEVSEAAANYKASHIAPVVRAGLLEYMAAQALNGKAAYDVHGAVKGSIERTAARQMATLRKGLSALATVGSTAPFVGLFGTTFGIINSFQGMAKEGGGGLGAIAAGIAEALVTTAVGIGVAIAAVLLYNYFTSRIEGLEVDTNETAGEVVALLAKDQAKG